MKKMFVMLCLSLMSVTAMAKEYKFGVNYTYSYMPLGWALEQEFPKVAKEMGMGDATLKMVNFPNSKVGFDLMLNDQLDVIVASPTLVNNYEVKDPGKVKFLAPMNLHNAGLRCRGYKTIEDIKKRPPVVAVPGRQVTNHMVLQWIGETYLGNKNFFDDRLVVLKTQQLLQIVKSGSKEIDCAVWGSPIQNQLTDEDGFNLIVETDDVKHWHGFINMVVAKKQVFESNPKLGEVLVETLKRVNAQWQKNPHPYLEMYMTKSNVKGDPSKMLNWYKESKMFGRSPELPPGLDKNLRYATEIGFVKQLGYSNIADMFWKPELLGKK